jgi:hypothetical protein
VADLRALVAPSAEAVATGAAGAPKRIPIGDKDMKRLTVLLILLLLAAPSYPQTHSVALTWTASTSSGVTGYNAYRSSTSGGPYSKINSALISGTSYTDSSVTAGQTYYYVATAVANGVESGYSSETSATVPGATQAVTCPVCNAGYVAHVNQGGATAGDVAGTIALSKASSASHTFNTPYSSTPVCVLTPISNPTGLTPWWVTATSTQLTVHTAVSGTITFNYHCTGNPN